MNSTENQEVNNPTAEKHQPVSTEPAHPLTVKMQFWRSVRWPLIFLVLLWLIRFFSIDTFFNGMNGGIQPRRLEGLYGIFFAPFIHADYDHLFSNSLPVLIIGSGLFYFYRSIAWQVISLLWLLTGFWVWLMARPTSHIGCSGLIYGGVIFLFFSGIFRKDVRLMAISFLVVFLYGSLAWGILPLVPGQSWESHLAGSIAGLFCAIYYRQEGPQRRKFQWEIDEELEKLHSETTSAEEIDDSTNSENKIVVHYDYKPSDNSSQKGN
jgi:membrane associated rhomboid family serine protease